MQRNAFTEPHLFFRHCVAFTNLGSNGQWQAPNWSSGYWTNATAIAAHTAATEALTSPLRFVVNDFGIAALIACHTLSISPVWMDTCSHEFFLTNSPLAWLTDLCKTFNSRVNFWVTWSSVRDEVWSASFVVCAIQGLHYRFGTWCKECTETVHCVALWTRVTLQVLDMCKICTEAVHCVALWTRVTLQVWTCVKYVPKQSIP